MSDDGPLFQNADEQERIYAPQQVPDEQRAVEADEGADWADNETDDPPAAGVVAGVGPSSSGGMAAVPNISDEPSSGAPGDPQTEARDPMNDRQ